MRKFIPVVALLLATFGALRAGAQTLTADEKAFMDQHLSDIVTTEITRLNDAALAKVFAVPFYSVKMIIKEDDGGEGYTSFTAARVGTQLVNVTAPGTDGDLPKFLKMIDPKFKLAADADATVVQQALDALYPPFSDSDKKEVKFTHTGNQWMFVRGKFFDDKKGYVFTTGADGTITAVKYLLKLP
jgi:cellulose synthase/poly-beta-1,6-N-acetylglucosamine synthase-like glycosyltransferase